MADHIVSGPGSPTSPTSDLPASPATQRPSRPRPPLPPRFSSSPGAHAIITSSEHYLGPSAPSLSPSPSSCLTTDPRSSSSQSLRPSSFSDNSSTASRRTLLVVYIHGFYGNDQSFRSFPAHVHNYLRDALAYSHAVHTKIYPRYKTYRAIEVARDNFSAWLEPHESPTTDVILVGHSMGGILAGEVVLAPNRHPYSSRPFRHRILGTLSLDSPFLGLHPGIIVSGIASLFRPSPTPSTGSPSEEGVHSSPTPSSATTPTPLTINSSQTSQYGSVASEYTDQSSVPFPASPSPPPEFPDPFFNPPFFNDNAFEERPFHKRLARFVKKHSSAGIIGAARNHVLSHLEYGGCLADYPALHVRYNKLRALEDVDELATLHDYPNDPFSQKPIPVRVRFVNYFTIATGRPRKARSGTPSPTDEIASSTDTTLTLPVRQRPDSPESIPHSEDSDRLSRASSDSMTAPTISLARPRTHETLLVLDPIPMDQFRWNSQSPTSQNQDEEGYLQASSIVGDLPNGVLPAGTQPEAAWDARTPVTAHESEPDLPPIPDLPVQPPLPNLDSYLDKEARRQAEKEAKKAQKAYEQAVKHRDNVLRKRQQLLEKHRRRSEKKAARHAKQAAKDGVRERKQPHRREGSRSPARRQEGNERDPRRSSSGDAHFNGASKPPKERKFCVLPRPVVDGGDHTWVRVFMEGVDEVGAHCGLFELGPHYDRLVGDVAQRIVDWVHEDLSLATVRRLAEEGGAEGGSEGLVGA